MTKLLRFACLCTLLLLPAFLPAQSQITTGVMQGTILDPSGAVVSGAEVEIVNISTNLTKKLTTDGDGRFVALALQPGRYKVTVQKSGYTNLAYENVELTVGQSLYLSPRLSVAGGKETVVVTATPNLDPTKTESSSTLNEATVANTPVLGRKFEDLLTLTPGVSISQGPDGDEINFNGQRGIFNNISLDGGDYNNGFFGEQAGGQRAAIDITMEAVKEFQVIATGSNAEFGRTAGGVVNVITKSGTNQTHGSLFYYQRAEALSANQSDGTPLTDFNREQFGGSLGGALKKDKVFGFLAYEGIAGNLQRPNLSQPIGSTPCPVSAPVITADEAAINGNPDCQRLALVNFYDTTFGQDESLPVRRPLHNHALLGKLDWNINQANQFNFSYNFDASRKVNETFDVPTYGTSANGIEGTSYINGYRANLNTSITANVLNEARFSYIHESRPRQASPSNVLADTAIGSALTPTPFRFGNPFFVQPNVDETFWRTQIADNVSWVKGKHTIKVGGEWLHSLNSQVFRGFFSGRYIFSDVAAFLRYAQPEAPGGFGPSVEGCTGGGFITTSLGETCATSSTGTPLLLYLQGANQDLSPATDATGASSITNQDFALFIQDKWQIHPRLTLNYGLRWEAQIFPDPTTPPSGTVYGPFLSDPTFPSDGTIPNQTKQFQPRVGLAWDIRGDQKSVFRSSFGIYNARQNMLTQISAITTNGVQQATVALGPFVPSTILPAYPGLFAATPLAPGTFPSFSGVHVFDRDYHNPRVYTANFGYEQQLARDMVFYSDFTWSKAVFLTNILNYGRADRVGFFDFFGPTFPENVPLPQLGDVLVHSSRANSLYRGLTMGIRKSYSHNFQMDANYTYAQDWDNDSNERDPFTDRSGPASATDPFPLRNDYSPSDRDIRHRFNFIMTGDMPWGFQGNMRFQAHSAQPLTGPDGRNTLRKDNVYASMDWRLSRPFKFHDRFALIPTMEMFNTFNSDNNIIPESTSPLFNFQGYVRQGLGDPRQLQLALRFTF